MRRGSIAVALLAGCSLKAPTQPCAAATDCQFPLVCCSGGLALETDGRTGPTCFDPNLCTAGGGTYLPFLTEGSPCARVDGAEACGGGLACCPRTLTCLAESACDATPTPSVEAVEATSCGSDLDCARGICCGISYKQRDGQCSAVGACAERNGVVIPRPDAGPAPADAGQMASLAEQICARAFCDERGVRAPSNAERAGCLEAFTTGVDGEGRSGLVASEACLATVEATRDMCAWVFRWREADLLPGVIRERPVLPAQCYSTAPTPPADLSLTCAKLQSCGKTSDAAACAAQLASLNYDTVSRVHEWEGCNLPVARLGHAPMRAMSRCNGPGQCPAPLSCDATITRGGVCTMSSCDASACASHGGVCDEGICKRSCNATIRSGNQRTLVELQCGGRVNPDGKPPELACGLTAGGGGLCTPARDLSSCPGGAEPASTVLGGPWTGAYQCKAQPGTVARFEACVAGTPDPCASGACVQGRCLEPCVLHPIGVTAPSCPSTELCATTLGAGWGAVAVCRPKCGAGGACPAGMVCTPGWPDEHCRPM